MLGIGDSEFVDRSISDLSTAAESVAAQITAVKEKTEAMDWKGDDRKEFDQKKDALLLELGIVERTLRAKADELTEIRRKQRAASG